LAILGHELVLKAGSKECGELQLHLLRVCPIFKGTEIPYGYPALVNRFKFRRFYLRRVDAERFDRFISSALIDVVDADKILKPSQDGNVAKMLPKGGSGSSRSGNRV
jgi:hypothetical protein